MRGPLLSLILALPLVASNACTPPRTISDIQLRFDPELKSGFYSLPMPNDARRLEGDAGGRPHPNYWDFPNPTDSDQLG